MTLELTMLSSTPGALETAWAEYGWDTVGTLEFQSPVVWVDPAPGGWSALFQVFAGGQPPLGPGDLDGDTEVNVQDVFLLINYLFAGGPAPG